MLILVSAVTGCVSFDVFTSAVGTPIGITSSAVGLKIYPIITEIRV